MYEQQVGLTHERGDGRPLYKRIRDFNPSELATLDEQPPNDIVTYSNALSLSSFETPTPPQQQQPTVVGVDAASALDWVNGSNVIAQGVPLLDAEPATATVVMASTSTPITPGCSSNAACSQRTWSFAFGALSGWRRLPATPPQEAIF